MPRTMLLFSLSFMIAQSCFASHIPISKNSSHSLPSIIRCCSITIGCLYVGMACGSIGKGIDSGIKQYREVYNQRQLSIIKQTDDNGELQQRIAQCEKETTKLGGILTQAELLPEAGMKRD